MRRLAAMVLMVLMLTSCAPKEATPVTSGFACDVGVSYDTAMYNGTLKVHDDATVVFVLTEPSTVSGLTLTFSNDQLTMTLAGIELALSDTQVPAGAVVRLLSKALEQAAKQAAVSPSCEMQGDLDGVAYTLRFDNESGLPISLSVPAYALTLTFSAWCDIS